MSEARIEKLALSKCLAIAHKRNPKAHDIESLVAGFRRFGFVAFPTIDEASGVMVAGHGRCEALESMRVTGQHPPAGIDEVGTEWMLPVIRGVSFASESERDAYLIADNQLTLAGGWRFEALSEMLGELEGEGGFAGLGFQAPELESLLGQYTEPAPGEPDGTRVELDAAPEPKRGRTEITARIQCPHCGEMIER